MPKQQLLGRAEHYAAFSAAAEKAPTGRAGPVMAAAKEQDGNTVLKFADRSTITLVGVACFDQLTLFGGQLRAIRRVV